MKVHALWYACLVVLVALLALPASAQKPWTLQYEGSYTFPSMGTSGWGDYYPGSGAITFVPNGTPRPTWGGDPVQGPTILVSGGWGARTRECGPIPALVKSGSLNTAPLIPLSSGGTAFNGGWPVTTVDSTGMLWGLGPSSSSNPTALYESNSTASAMCYLGTNRSLANAHCTGWPGTYPITGIMRRGDGSGNDLPSDGHQVSPPAKFLLMQHANVTPDPLNVWQATRTGPTTVSSSLLFVITNALNFTDGMAYSFEYVRDKNGEEWYLLWKKGPHTGDSFKFYVFEGTASGGGTVLAKHEYDIGPDIVAGAGWHHSTSQIPDIGVDWANCQIHVLDGGVVGTPSPYHRTGRVHVFTVIGIPPPPKGTAIIIK